MPTIKDVAKMADVSVGTVSKVLNNDPTVKGKNRENILKAIKKLGYSPNIHAKHLSTGKTGMISVIVPTIGYEFQERLINSIDGVLSEYGFDSILFPLLSRERLERFSDPSHYLYHTDGLLVTSLSLSRMFPSNSLPTDKPYIMVDTFDGKNDCVHIDNRAGGKLAAKNLRIHDESKILMISGTENDEVFSSRVFKERADGFSEGLADRGVDLSRVRKVSAVLGWSRAYDLGVEIGREMEGKFSVFSISDILAWGFMEGCKSVGKTVGKDFSIIGYDDLRFSEKLGISTVRQPVEEMGKTAAESLIEKISKGSKERTYVKIEPEYVERSTN